MIGIDGKPHTSDQATIWRWRNQFQNDFAARMSWTIEPYEKANHPPIVVINGQTGKQAMTLNAKLGDKITLDASASTDPDGDRLHYHWFHYREAGYSGTIGAPGLAGITVNQADQAKASISIKSACRKGWLNDQRVDCPNGGQAHVILEVTDSGTPALTSYRRVIIHVAP